MKKGSTRKVAVKKLRRIAVTLQAPAEMLPGVVSYPVHVTETAEQAARLPTDRTFAESLMKRLTREARQIQRSNDYR